MLAKGRLGRGAKAATDKVRDKVEDVQEAWETSQVNISCLWCLNAFSRLEIFCLMVYAASV